MMAGAMLLAPGSALAQSAEGSFVTELRAKHSSQCLTAAGSAVGQSECNESNDQQFTFVPVDGIADTYTVQSEVAALCLDVSQHRTNDQFDNRPVVYLWQCHGKSNQRFKLIETKDGGSVLRSPDGRCVDVAGANTSSDASLISYDCHGMANQRFAVTAADGASPVNPAPAPVASAPTRPAEQTSGSVVAAETETETEDMSMAGMPASGAATGGDETADNAAAGNAAAGNAMNGMSMAGMTQLPASELPDGMAGSGQLLLQSKAQTTRSNDPQVASFRIDCEFSHMNYDDSIVKPGQPGKAHLHQYFGNTDADAYSTSDSIINSGNSTCAGGTANRSAYWAPALIDARTDKPVKPDGATIYYKTGFWGDYPANTVSPPNGLRVIAGNQNESAPDGTRYTTKTDWFCTEQGNLSGPFNTGEAVPTDCSNGDLLRMRVRFPNCWDGQNLDSADHKSHMAYSLGSGNNRRGCPASHPVQIPTMTVNVDWIVNNRSDVQHWRLSSDMYDESIPAGYSAHADWIVGWNQPIFERMLAGCYRPAKDCGHNNLNDGEGLKPL